MLLSRGWVNFLKIHIFSIFWVYKSKRNSQFRWSQLLYLQTPQDICADGAKNVMFALNDRSYISQNRKEMEWLKFVFYCVIIAGRTNVKGSNTFLASRCMVSCGAIAAGWGLLTSRNVSHVRGGFLCPESVFHSFPSGQGMDGCGYVL